MLKSKESDLDSSLPSSSFLKPNGIHNPYDLSDMELVSITNSNSSSSNNHNCSTSHHAQYTSLKDILPATPSPPSGISPTHNSSWHEIPIRNPLLKHAAWAYLQPMSQLPESGHSTFLSKLKSVCCEVSCFDYFKHSISRVFSNRRDSDDDDDEVVDDDDYCCAVYKVD